MPQYSNAVKQFSFALDFFTNINCSQSSLKVAKPLTEWKS